MRLRRVRIRGFLTAVAGAAALMAWCGATRADMTLTAAGTTAGFSLSTFADSFPTYGIGNVGPVGIGFAPGGNVLVTDYRAGSIYSFTDTDGQHASPGNQLSATDGASNYAGLATIGSTVYMAEQSNGRVGTVNPTTGAFTPITGNGSIPGATDALADPTTGNLYVSALGNGIYRVTNLSGTPVATRFSTVGADGISISADGSTLYAASGGDLVAVSTSTGNITRNYGFVNGIDGTALGTGTIAGEIFANTNDGRIVEIDLTSGLQTVIASGGSRGDLVKVDPNGTLLLTQSDRVLRLTAPAGGGFSTPEPSTLAPVLTGLAASFVVALRRRRRAPAGEVA